jgi:hypothetical protein
VKQWAVYPEDWWNDDNYQSAYELAIFLHKCGLDMAERPADYFSPLLTCFLYPSWEPYLPSLSTCWQSSKAADDFDVASWTQATDTVRVTTFPIFAAFQPAIQPNFYGLPLKERVITWLLYDVVDARSFRKVVQRNESITRNDAVELAESHINLLSLAVRSFVQSQFRPWYNQSTWNELMHDLVPTLGEVNLLQEEYSPYDVQKFQSELSYGNPLIVCILSSEFTFFYSRYRARKRSFERHLHTEVMKWLQILQDCNIDLERYGQHEYGMIFRKDSQKRLFGSRTEGWAWTGFSWGPNPSDWVFHLDRVVERFSGDFWRLIDNPIQQVPGAWIDDDDVWDEDLIYADDLESELEDDYGDDSDHESGHESNAEASD